MIVGLGESRPSVAAASRRFPPAYQGNNFLRGDALIHLTFRARAAATAAALALVVAGCSSETADPKPSDASESSVAGSSAAAATAANKYRILYFDDQMFTHNRLDPALVDEFIRRDYIQHNPGIGNGSAALRTFVDGMSKQYPGVVFVAERAVAQGDMVMVHSNYKIPGTAGMSVMDVYRLKDGKRAEHWDALQMAPAKTASGHDMFGTLTAPKVWGPDLSADTAASQKLVEEFYAGLTAKGYSAAVEESVANDLVQHAPDVADGAAALKEYYAKRLSAGPGAKLSLVRIVAEGDLVGVHARYQSGPTDRGQSVMEFLRVRDGRIVERWANVQDVPEKAANDNTMF